MERYVKIVLCILFATASSLPSKQYRTDYEYNRKTDAFYKLHIKSEEFSYAKHVCASEGAQLMSPVSREDLTQLHGMFKSFPYIGNLVRVDSDGQQHESVEEVPLIDLTSQQDEERRNFASCDVVTRKGLIEPYSCWNKLPFICKVDAKDAPYDSQCGVYASDYQYLSSVGSCYKVPLAAYTWNEAYTDCRAQGAHLMVLNSEAEHLAINSFLHTAPMLVKAHTTYDYFAGIRAKRVTDGSSREFRTVFNETLEEAGYSGWSDGEPNNYMDSEYCGAIFTNTGKYNDVDCNDYYAFICEKEVRNTTR